MKSALPPSIELNCNFRNENTTQFFSSGTRFPPALYVCCSLASLFWRHGSAFFLSTFSISLSLGRKC